MRTHQQVHKAVPVHIDQFGRKHLADTQVEPVEEGAAYLTLRDRYLIYRSSDDDRTMTADRYGGRLKVLMSRLLEEGP